MAAMVPYGNYDRMLRRGFPFDAFDEFFSHPLASQLTTGEGGFRMNVEDAGDAYVITAELPGVKRDDIDVELNEGRLSISVEKKESEEDKNKNYLLKETHEWSAMRGIYLKDAAVQGLSARLADGVLTVNVPKLTEKSNITKISID